MMYCSLSRLAVAAALFLGTYAMQIFVTNATTTPNNSQTDHKIIAAGGTAVTPGAAFHLSFWTKSIANGPSYVQNYGLSWRNVSNAQIDFVGWTGFSSGNGTWTQINATDLVAPASATNAVIQVCGTTGAVAGGYGGSWIDDVSFSAAVFSVSTNKVTPTITAGIQGSWMSESGVNYQVQKCRALEVSGDWSNLGAVSGAVALQTWFEATGTNRQIFLQLSQSP